METKTAQTTEADAAAQNRRKVSAIDSIESSERARQVFRERTGIDPDGDSVVRDGVSTAAITAMVEAFARAGEWCRKARKAGDPPDPRPLWAWNVFGNPRQGIGEAGGNDPGPPVELRAVADRTMRAWRALGEAIGEADVVLDELHLLDQEYSADYVGFGSWREVQPSHRRKDVVSTRFVRRLDRVWRAAERGELGVTEILLLAIYFGLEPPPGGDWGRLFAKWVKKVGRARS